MPKLLGTRAHAFQADDEGSIPFTRSSLFSDLRTFRPSGLNSGWVQSLDFWPLSVRGAHLASALQSGLIGVTHRLDIDRRIGLVERVRSAD